MSFRIIGHSASQSFAAVGGYEDDSTSTENDRQHSFRIADRAAVADEKGVSRYL